MTTPFKDPTPGPTVRPASNSQAQGELEALSPAVDARGSGKEEPCRSRR
jgi:hypothetical protein